MPIITFKVSESEAARIRRDARVRKTPVSAYIRAQLFPVAASPTKRVFKRHPVSGAYYDATPGPVVTDEQIKAALADFP